MIPRPSKRSGFTLIEILLAAVAAALVLTAVYGIFRQAIRIRDGATRRTRDSRVLLRAENVLRADLRGALVSGGLLANVCEGDGTVADCGIASGAVSHSAPSNLPGYLRLTTTTGRNDAAGLLGDVQQVEYYVAQAPTSADGNASGTLVRAVTRDLLDGSGLSAPTTASSTAANTETAVLTGVTGFQVSFYDGANWQTSWQFSDLSTRIAPAYVASTAQTTTGQMSLPEAIRVEVQRAPTTPGGPTPAPLTILVPWTAQPYAAATPAIAGSATP